MTVGFAMNSGFRGPLDEFLMDGSLGSQKEVACLLSMQMLVIAMRLTDSNGTNCKMNSNNGNGNRKEYVWSAATGI